MLKRVNHIVQAIRNVTAFGWLRCEQEIDSELQFHIEMCVEENVQAGMSPVEARKDALRRFGDLDRIRTECMNAHLESPVRSFLEGLRTALVLGLGLGALFAVFFLVDQTLLRPLPQSSSDRLTMILGEHPESGREFVRVSMPDFLDWNQKNQSFEKMGLYCYRPVQFNSGVAPEQLTGLYASTGYFDIVDSRPWIGRGFREGDDSLCAPSTVMLSYEFWSERYNRDEDAVGQTLELNGVAYTVIGVMSPDFQTYNRSDLFFPLSLWHNQENNPNWRSERHFYAVAKLRQGVDVVQAGDDVQAIAANLSERYPKTNSGYQWRAEPLQKVYADPVDETLLLLLSAVGLLLLVSCSGAATRLVGRMQTVMYTGHSYPTKTGWRSLLEWNSRRFLWGVLLSSFAGGVIGLAVGVFSSDILRTLLADRFAHVFVHGVDGQIVGLCLLFSLLVGVVLWLLASLSVHKRFQGIGRVLIGLQLVLTLFALTSAGLLVWNLAKAERALLGFNSENLLTLYVDLPSAQYPNQRMQAQFFLQTMQGIDSLPGVVSVSGTEAMPLRSNGFFIPFQILRGQLQRPSKAEWAEFCRVGIDYHSLMEIPLVAGRYFSMEDNGSAPNVLVINRAMAEKFWPGESPIGQKVFLNNFPEERTVVGVVENVNYYGAEQEPTPRIYRCYWQFPSPRLMLVMRIADDPTVVADDVRGVFAGIDPTLSVGQFRTGEQVRDEFFAGRRKLVGMLSGIAAVALLALLLSFRRFVADHALMQQYSLKTSTSFQRATVRFFVWPLLVSLLVGAVGAAIVPLLLTEFTRGAESNMFVLYGVVGLSLLLLCALVVWLPARFLLTRSSKKAVIPSV